GNVGDHQPRPLRRQRVRVMAADALGAAGQDRNATVEPRHHFFPFRRRTNFSKPASCCLTMSLVGASVSSSVFSSNFFAAKVTMISGLPNKNASIELRHCRK